MNFVGPFARFLSTFFWLWSFIWVNAVCDKFVSHTKNSRRFFEWMWSQVWELFTCLLGFSSVQDIVPKKGLRLKHTKKIGVDALTFISWDIVCCDLCTIITGDLIISQINRGWKSISLRWVNKAVRRVEQLAAWFILLNESASMECDCTTRTARVMQLAQVIPEWFIQRDCAAWFIEQYNSHSYFLPAHTAHVTKLCLNQTTQMYNNNE